MRGVRFGCLPLAGPSSNFLDGLERDFKVFNRLEVGVCTTCAPGGRLNGTDRFAFGCRPFRNQRGAFGFGCRYSKKQNNAVRGERPSLPAFFQLVWDPNLVEGTVVLLPSARMT